MEKIFELSPIADCAVSYYRKAFVIERANGEKLLKSYDTIVCKITAKGKVQRFWSGYSATTMRHINSFLRFYGVNGGGKAWWACMKIEECSPWEESE